MKLEQWKEVLEGWKVTRVEMQDSLERADFYIQSIENKIVELEKEKPEVK